MCFGIRGSGLSLGDSRSPSHQNGWKTKMHGLGKAIKVYQVKGALDNLIDLSQAWVDQTKLTISIILNVENQFANLHPRKQICVF